MGQIHTFHSPGRQRGAPSPDAAPGAHRAASGDLDAGSGRQCAARSLCARLPQAAFRRRLPETLDGHAGAIVFGGPRAPTIPTTSSAANDWPPCLDGTAAVHRSARRADAGVPPRCPRRADPQGRAKMATIRSGRRRPARPFVPAGRRWPTLAPRGFACRGDASCGGGRTERHLSDPGVTQGSCYGLQFTPTSLRDDARGHAGMRG